MTLTFISLQGMTSMVTLCFSSKDRSSRFPFSVFKHLAMTSCSSAEDKEYINLIYSLIIFFKIGLIPDHIIFFLK